ncbi:MAG: hypothetical protein OEZ02_04905 [Anaerolineae bacterium]|nr:hypothetical protein [Anaerolineae bacterium]
MTTICIHVRLAEPFWRAVGQRDLSLELNVPAQVNDLIGLLRTQYPALAREMDEAAPVIFIGDVEAGPDAPLADNNHVHIVWPLAGG